MEANITPAKCRVFDGKLLAQSILDGILNKLDGNSERPCLSVVTLGKRKDVDSFVRSKLREAKYCNIEVIVKCFDKNIAEPDLLGEVLKLNNDARVDGILLQLPMPSHIHEQTICQAILHEKDVDSMHKENLGLLTIPQQTPFFVPCTAQAVVKILETTKTQLKGATACIVGASANVGIPLMLLLIRRGVTVTLAHIHTKDLIKHTCDADIVVSAAGVYNLISAEHVKEGAIVIDVGINFVPDAKKASGFRLVGDVDFASVSQKASWITPVPGGVGPVTSSLVLKATADAFLKFRGRKRMSLDIPMRPSSEK